MVLLSCLILLFIATINLKQEQLGKEMIYFMVQFIVHDWRNFWQEL